MINFLFDVFPLFFKTEFTIAAEESEEAPSPEVLRHSKTIKIMNFQGFAYVSSPPSVPVFERNRLWDEFNTVMRQYEY